MPDDIHAEESDSISCPLACKFSLWHMCACVWAHLQINVNLKERFRPSHPPFSFTLIHLQGLSYISLLLF